MCQRLIRTQAESEKLIATQQTPVLSDGCSAGTCAQSLPFSHIKTKDQTTDYTPDLPVRQKGVSYIIFILRPVNLYTDWK